jgi:uncharacterized protein (TIGR03435 family)
MRRLLVPFLLVVSLAAASDVISVVKPNRSDGIGSLLGVPTGNRWSATNVTVQALVSAAYGSTLPLRDEQIIGLPRWATRERFDIQARLEGKDLPEEPEGDDAVFTAFAVVRTILAERFAFRAHEVAREAPIYVLRRASDRPPALQATAVDCEAILRAGPFAEVLDANGWPLGPCGVRTRPGEIVGTGGTMSGLAKYLSRVRGVEREVVDRTEIEGRFDFRIEWTPPQPPVPAAAGVAPVTDYGPSIFTALDEQLGLRLESARGPVRVLVVDHLERPSPN